MRMTLSLSASFSIVTKANLLGFPLGQGTSTNLTAPACLKRFVRSFHPVVSGIGPTHKRLLLVAILSVPQPVGCLSPKATAPVVVGYARCLGDGAVVPVLNPSHALSAPSPVYPGGSAGRSDPNRRQLPIAPSRRRPLHWLHVSLTRITSSFPRRRGTSHSCPASTRGMSGN